MNKKLKKLHKVKDGDHYWYRDKNKLMQGQNLMIWRWNDVGDDNGGGGYCVYENELLNFKNGNKNGIQITIVL